MITDEELKKILKNACKKAGSQRKWAMDNKISPSHVNDTLRGNRKIGTKIGAALGYKKVKSWTIKETEQK